ncbi:helix-turn-helix domain-containing protein [Nocardia sp. R7R-8]|uniref:helix-turn-helix domain-containing protein n=1 Tax=Nocardia sp. R7R-8 TaxID=3459304 RepID=UPI00403E125B
MRGLVERELGALASRDAHAVRLRETLHAYLRNQPQPTATNRNQRSPEATAKILGVHKNTVRYRVQRIARPERLFSRRGLACGDAAQRRLGGRRHPAVG